MGEWTRRESHVPTRAKWAPGPADPAGSVGATLLAVICLLLAVSRCRRRRLPRNGLRLRQQRQERHGDGDRHGYACARWHAERGQESDGQLPPNPVNSEVYVVNSDSGSVSVIDSRSNQLLATMAVQRNPYSLAVTPDGDARLCGQCGLQHGYRSESAEPAIAGQHCGSRRSRARRGCRRMANWWSSPRAAANAVR